MPQGKTFRVGKSPAVATFQMPHSHNKNVSKCPAKLYKHMTNYLIHYYQTYS